MTLPQPLASGMTEAYGTPVPAAEAFDFFRATFVATGSVDPQIVAYLTSLGMREVTSAEAVSR